MDWVNLAQDRDQWRNMVMKLQIIVFENSSVAE
jgi:hypothetical protein